MDSALILKQKVANGEVVDFRQAEDYLQSSVLLQQLLVDFPFTVLNMLNRLTQIVEIPFTNQLKKVCTWTKLLAEASFCQDGFSYTGKKDDILSCYNAMITSVLIRLKYADWKRIDKGIGWIMNFQNITRKQENKWLGSAIMKYGGCMKYTPCYIGVVKSMVALSDYKYSNIDQTFDVDEKLSKGLDYILEHQVFLRKSDEQPITKNIVKLTYPFTYNTNVVEILGLLKTNQRLSDSRCRPAIGLLKAKMRKDGYWRMNSIYLPQHWVAFDKPRLPGLWLSHEITRILK